MTEALKRTLFKSTMVFLLLFIDKKAKEIGFFVSLTKLLLIVERWSLLNSF